MSWLSAVTGKAEDFLNKLDQSAATTFHHADAPPTQITTPSTQQITVGGSKSSSQILSSSSQSVPSRLKDLKGSVNPTSGFVSSPVKQTPVKTAAPPKPAAASVSDTKVKKDTDEALFEFLNSKDPVESKKKAATPVSSRHHSRQSSTSSNVSHKDVRPPVVEVTSQVEVVSSEQTQEGESQRESPTGSNASADIEALADAMQESPANSEHSSAGDIEKGDNSKLSSLELENRLLRNEIASLNQEMASLIQRAKDSQIELVKTKKKLEDYHNSASMHDQLVRELQARESDLSESLAAKDSQLAVLRVRLEEADRSVKAREKQIENLQSHRERILKDHTDSSGMHSQALDSLKEKLSEVEASLRREQDAFKHAQQEAAGRQSRLEQEQQTMAEALTAAERKLTEERGKVTGIANQLKTAKLGVDSARQELTDYKEKASRILQSKERLISSLREGSGVTGEVAGVSSLEHDSLKQEKDMLKDELQQTKMVSENLRAEMLDLEGQLQQDSDSAAEQIKSLEEQILEEKTRKEDTEQELLKQKQELQYAIDEINKQKTSFQSRISDREREIEKLRNQLMTKSISSSSEGELESRVRALTDSLIQKQTMLEALSTEKNSLVLQLERMEQQYRDIQECVRSTPAVVNANDDEEGKIVRQRLPGFMREGPADHEMTKRMKRAANVIDKFSVRLGIFLRRYPIARVFVIVYMVLLHLWVMIVLLTYQPEMHGADYQPKPPHEDPH
ncbi:golgin subfamily A member 5-like isoform X1 [Haliotis rubra]|uniref:golgin subfamily A member 5-like isoform X1 n=1 Tax=Haliotis rubra TaxID=36100 RepID=UPI001EE5CDA4|nr:golgin subfamily A member 5-like isoform X1 [Haliotis rubra]XP_046561936.1 golgin subfamily A member 5-like isoform X1 [Haliotis rubra]